MKRRLTVMKLGVEDKLSGHAQTRPQAKQGSVLILHRQS